MANLINNDPFDSLMVHTCTFMQKVSGSDDFAGSTRGYTNVLAGTPCRLSTLNNGDEATSEKQTSKKQQKLFLRPQAVTHQMKVEVFYQATSLGVFDITSVDDPSNIGHHIELIVEKVDF